MGIIQRIRDLNSADFQKLIALATILGNLIAWLWNQTAQLPFFPKVILSLCVLTGCCTLPPILVGIFFPNLTPRKRFLFALPMMLITIRFSSIATAKPIGLPEYAFHSPEMSERLRGLRIDETAHNVVRVDGRPAVGYDARQIHIILPFKWHKRDTNWPERAYEGEAYFVGEYSGDPRGRIQLHRLSLRDYTGHPFQFFASNFTYFEVPLMMLESSRLANPILDALDGHKQ